MLKRDADHITPLLRTFRESLVLSVSNLTWLPWQTGSASWGSSSLISQRSNDLFSFPWLTPICTIILNLEDGSSRKLCLTLKSNSDTLPIYLVPVLLWQVLSPHITIAIYLYIFPRIQAVHSRIFIYFFPLSCILWAHSVPWTALIFSVCEIVE